MIEGLVLDDGATLPTDMLVLACGVRPRVDLARASGLPVNKGIVVNDTLATEVPGVYAFGECAEHARQDVRPRRAGLGAGGRPRRRAHGREPAGAVPRARSSTRA